MRLRSRKMKMKELVNEVKAFLAEEKGLTIVEYAIGGALVAAGAVLAFTNLGESVCSTIDGLASAVQSGAGGADCGDA